MTWLEGNTQLEMTYQEAERQEQEEPELADHKKLKGGLRVRQTRVGEL